MRGGAKKPEGRRVQRDRAQARERGHHLAITLTDLGVGFVVTVTSSLATTVGSNLIFISMRLVFIFISMRLIFILAIVDKCVARAPARIARRVVPSA